MRPAADYVTTDKPVTFYTVAEAARRRGEVAIGYRRIRKDEPDSRGLAGVVVNPVKSLALTYGPVDRIIVLARE